MNNVKNHTMKEAKKMKKPIFVQAVLELLGDIVVVYEEYGTGEVTILVKDINMKVQGRELIQYIEEELKAKGFKEVDFNFGNGNWFTVYNYKR